MGFVAGVAVADVAAIQRRAGAEVSALMNPESGSGMAKRHLVVPASFAWLATV